MIGLRVFETKFLLHKQGCKIPIVSRHLMILISYEIYMMKYAAFFIISTAASL